MICVKDNFAGQKVFECFHDIDDLRRRQFCRRKVYEYFQHNDDLRRKQFCRRKNL